MFKKKRKVGRPSNASIKREKRIKLFGALLIISLFGILFYSVRNYIYNNSNKVSASISRTTIEVCRTECNKKYKDGNARSSCVSSCSISCNSNGNIYSCAIRYVNGSSNSTSNGSSNGSSNSTSNGSSNSTSNKSSSSNKNIKNVSIKKIQDQAYTGNKITPQPIIKDGNKTLVKDRDYKLSYANNINIGVAKIKITGIGDYKGTRIIKFNISKVETMKEFTTTPDSKDNSYEDLKNDVENETNTENVDKSKIHTVIYNLNDGVSKNVEQKYVSNSNNKFSKVVPRRKGYTFVNWYLSGNESRKFNPGDSIPEGMENITLVASWQINTVNITYDANGAKVVKMTNSDWSLNNSKIYHNGSLAKQVINYGGTLEKSGLIDPDSCKELHLEKKDYKIVGDKEWICISGCNKGKDVFDEETVYKASDFCDVENKSCNVVLKANWQKGTPKKLCALEGTITNNTNPEAAPIPKPTNPGKVIIKLHADGGKVNIKKDKTWGLIGSLVSHNGKIKTHKIKYGESLDKYGLTDPDSNSELNLTKKGYKIVKGKEWKCVSGCMKVNKIFNDTKVYKSYDFCDAAGGDCEVVLKVNWQKK